MIKKTYNFDEELLAAMEKFAVEDNSTVTGEIAAALRLYQDYRYMQDKATVINQDVLNVARSMANMAERNINYKTNKYLSELAVQQAMLNLIIAKSLDFSREDLEVFRLKALDTIKETPRVLRLDEVHDG